MAFLRRFYWAIGVRRLWSYCTTCEFMPDYATCAVTLPCCRLTSFDPQDMAAATGRPVNPAWADVLAHLPPIPTTAFHNTTVLGMASGLFRTPFSRQTLSLTQPTDTHDLPYSMHAPHLPLLPLAACTAPYGRSNWTNMNGMVNHLFPIWPGAVLSRSEANATLLAAAVASFEWAAWRQSNSMSYVFSSATRVGVPATTFLPQWHGLLQVRGQR
jgi:hypothetical protein